MKTYEVTITNTGSIIVKANSSKEAFDIVLNMSRDEIIEKANLCGWEPSDVTEIIDSIQAAASNSRIQSPKTNCNDIFWLICVSKEEIFSVFEQLVSDGYKSAAYDYCLYEQTLDNLKEYYKNGMLWKPTCFFVNKKKKTFCLVHYGYVNTMETECPFYEVKETDFKSLL